MSKTTSQRLVAWLYNGKHCVVLDTTKFHLFEVVFEHRENVNIFKIPKIFDFCDIQIPCNIFVILKPLIIDKWNFDVLNKKWTGGDLNPEHLPSQGSILLPTTFCSSGLNHQPIV